MGNRGDVYERYYMPNFVDKDSSLVPHGVMIWYEQLAASNVTAGHQTT